MSHKPDYENMSVFEQLRQGLKESAAHAQGRMTLRTTTLATPAPEMSKTRVASIRARVGMSQAVFASYLNVPTKTLQSWEQGARKPKASEARLLQIAEAAPDEFERLVRTAKSARSRPRKAPRKTTRRRGVSRD